MKYIRLTQGKQAIVDDADFEDISNYQWYYKNSGGGGYAVRNSTRDESGRRTTIWMHRQIMGTPPNMETDHINHNKLDNRRRNLRICTKSQNQLNRKKQEGASRYKGVSWKKKTQRWAAQIQIDNKKLHLGYFATEEEAAMAYYLTSKGMLKKLPI